MVPTIEEMKQEAAYRVYYGEVNMFAAHMIMALAAEYGGEPYQWREVVDEALEETDMSVPDWAVEAIDRVLEKV